MFNQTLKYSTHLPRIPEDCPSCKHRVMMDGWRHHWRVAGHSLRARNPHVRSTGPVQKSNVKHRGSKLKIGQVWYHVDSAGLRKSYIKINANNIYLPPFRVWWFVYDKKDVPLLKTQLFWLDRGVVEHCFCEVLKKSNRFPWNENHRHLKLIQFFILYLSQFGFRRWWGLFHRAFWSTSPRGHCHSHKISIEWLS